MYYEHDSTLSNGNALPLLTSPFDPAQAIQDNPDCATAQHSDQFVNSSLIEPLGMPMNHHINHDFAYVGPIDFHSPKDFTSIHYPAMSASLPNDIFSRSPESSSSSESNPLIHAPSHQYYNTNQLWPHHPINVPTSHSIQPFHSQVCHDNEDSRRSSSVPLQLSFDPSSDTLSSPHPNNEKASPVQIERINTMPRKRTSVEGRRQRMDERLSKVNFDDITVAELKDFLRERGLSVTGRKAELMGRLKQEYDSLFNHPDSDNKPPTEVSQPNAIVHRRTINTLTRSPKKSPKKAHRTFIPYPTQTHHRLATSVPETHPHSYMNDQYMMHGSSRLRQSIDGEGYNQCEMLSSFNEAGYPIENVDPYAAPNQLSTTTTTTETWDNQAFQNLFITMDKK
ncbi:hypothetical protein RMCBS344292_05543 [Rhizopus microsporus]|nr:hypothetical protein RMCBS344292_05543 [Rhizopus microsporus]